MRRQTVLTAAVYAVGSFVTTMALVLPTRLDATEPNLSKVEQTNGPTLTVDNVHLQIRYDGKPALPGPMVVEPGSMRQVELLASNTGSTSAEIKARVSFLSSGPINRFARVPLRLSAPFTVEEVSLNLRPGESRTLMIPCTHTFASGERITILIEHADSVLEAAHLSVRPEPSTGARMAKAS